jgi:hypothetical protein
VADKKRKYRRAKKNDLLMPHVADDALRQPPTEELSLEEQRARDTVEALYRDLFGDTTQQKTAVMTAQAQDEVPDEEELPQEDAAEPSDAPEEELSPEIQDDTYPEGEEAVSEPLFLEQNASEPISLKEQLESSGEDFRLLLDMEYEKELGDAIGFERIRAYHERNINGRKPARSRKEDASGEYDRPDQNAEIAIARSYKRAHSRWAVRLALSFLFFAVILCYENGPWMATLFGGPLDGSKYPLPYILVGIQLLLLDAALCYRPLWEGVRHMLRFSPVDHSAHVGVLLITFLYHILLLFVPHTQAPTLLLSPAALCLVILSATELLNSYREALAFWVVSRRQQKYAMLPRICVGAEQQSARVRLYEDADRGNVWYLRPIGFVRNYFANTSRHVSRHRHLGAHFLLILALGTALGLFAFAGGAGGARVIGFALAATLLCAPVISAILSSLPLFFSGFFSLKRKAAIIGESPLEKGSIGDTLVLPDNEIFLSMERERFRLLDLCDAHRVTVLLRALLEKLQSPLAASFAVDSDSRLSTAELTLSHIGQEGVCADFSRMECRVALGTAEYMTERGLTLKPVADSTERPLYVAVDDRVCAVFYVHYTLSADIEPLLKDLRRAGLKVAVRSKDPCVREDVFARLLGERIGRITVQKPSASELDLRTDRVDATVVALHSCKQLARTVVVCRRISRVGVWGKLLQLICVCSGAVLAALLTFFDLLLPGVVITLWILFWCGVYALLSYFYLRPQTEDI